MPTRRAIPAFALLFAVSAATPAAAQHGAGVQSVLQRARAATGGGAWNAARGYHEMGVENGRPYERWVDMVRWGERVEAGAPPTRVVQGYNGFGLWWLPLSTPRPPGTEAELLRRARSDAYFAAYGYFFTGRFDVRSSALGVRPSGGRPYDVVRIQPAGGDARELWFDRATGRLGRIVETGPQPRIVEFSDYRRVGRLTLPFQVTTYGQGRAKPDERRLERIEVTSPDRAMFSLPRPPGPDRRR
jgi:hypothetical protein